MRVDYLNVKQHWLPAIIAGFLIGLLVTVSLHWRDKPAATLPVSYADQLAPVLPFTVSVVSSHSINPEGELLRQDPVLSPFLRPVPEQTSLGSGILISRDGLVVTNAHVVQAAQDILVISHHGLRAQVSAIWIDPETDIALLQTTLQIDADLPVNAARSERVGDIVFTIGNPFGIGQSVSQGIISAIGRQQPGLTNLTDFIQTDAAINPGNSGGALVNARGEVIGMNSAIFSAHGQWQGIGFALPFDKVLMIARQLAEQGSVERGYLGIDVRTLSETDRSAASGAHAGLRIVAVQPDSPAARAGVRSGDILLAINAVPLTDRTSAARLISALMPGKQTTLTLLRDGQPLELAVVLASRQP